MTEEFCMSKKTTQLVDLELNEISGVDHPANLHEGWLVMKSSDDSLDKALAEAHEALTTETTIGEEMSELTHDEPTAEVEKEVVSVPVIDEDLRKEMSDLRKELAEARAEAETVKTERDMEKATARAEDWAILPNLTPSEFAPILHSLQKSAPEEAEVIENIFDGCATALNEAGVLKELGTEASDDVESSAWDRIESLAKQLVENGEATNLADGISKTAKANPEMYAAYVQEMGA
tara:strand:- start:98 stop:802 length:705 start_codon:yes stop_codon:yes gene_type:complete